MYARGILFCLTALSGSDLRNYIIRSHTKKATFDRNFIHTCRCIVMDFLDLVHASAQCILQRSLETEGFQRRHSVSSLYNIEHFC